VRALVPAFTRTSWEWHGQYFDFAARNVVPKPMQKPHPPLWVACSNIQTIASAGRWGMGALGFQFVSPEAARAWVHRYYTELTQNLDKLADYPVNPNIAMVSGFMCAETDAQALEKASGWTFFVFCLSHYGRNGIPTPGEGNMWEAYQAWRHTDKAQETLRSGLIGSPATIRQRLRAVHDIGAFAWTHLYHSHECQRLEGLSQGRPADAEGVAEFRFAWQTVARLPAAVRNLIRELGGHLFTERDAGNGFQVFHRVFCLTTRVPAIILGPIW